MTQSCRVKYFNSRSAPSSFLHDQEFVRRFEELGSVADRPGKQLQDVFRTGSTTWGNSVRVPCMIHLSSTQSSFQPIGHFQNDIA
ncbi:hypothetical protein TNIN_275071 [Trichonephila inaurata madagascariensis]|uniref:Uncharacterized protein n=1 Tax=Trichonephila inaurata madagascariensis TaxID=2747483 RepID=A0A8X6XMU1_9ARAC|nr:hypothetical protein TNIN_275071 [Trichonephila inaurata madagascariensis]